MARVNYWYRTDGGLIRASTITETTQKGNSGPAASIMVLYNKSQKIKIENPIHLFAKTLFLAQYLPIQTTHGLATSSFST
jgi:hypothetical protein